MKTLFTLRIALLLVFLSPLVKFSHATHIMGVDITYECIGNCTYRVHWRAYRDCSGASAIAPNVGFSGQGAGCNQPVQLTGWSAQQTTEVTPICPGIPTRCTSPNASINGVQEYYRYADFDFCNTNCTVFNITWTDCCRNNAITSGSAGQAMFTGQTTIDLGIVPCNNSPQFLNPPIPYVCAGQPFTFNQGATDADGDSLVYSLGPCYQGNGNQITYGNGYSPTQPLGPSWNVNLNAQTGDISLTPNPGNMVVGVLCVYVTEFRNGIQIGQVVRDVQVTVINCGNNTLPSVAGATNVQGGTANGFTVNTCMGGSLCFDVAVIDPDAGQTQTLWWNQNIPNATFVNAAIQAQQDTITGSQPTGRFCWTPAAPGTYNFLVTIEDDACPMLGSNQYTFTIIVSPPFTLTASAVTQCLNATFTPVPVGGTAPFTYQWTGQGGLNAIGNNPTHGYAANGIYSYTVTATDAAGCQATYAGNVNIPLQVSVNTTVMDASCNGATDGSATAIAGNGTGPYSYSWNTNPPQNTPAATALAAGNYTVTVTDGNGCTAQALVTVNEPPALQLNFVAQDASCAGGADGSATATPSGGTSPYSWSWNTNPVQTGITAVNLAAGTYICTITDVNGCTIQGQAQINEPQPVAVNATAVAVSCNGGNNGAASAIASGGTAPYNYSWNTNPVQNTQAAGNLPAGNYTVTVTDANGCTGQAQVQVTEPAALSASVSGNPVSCFGGNNGIATVIASGGTAPYSYSWNTNPVQTNATASGLQTGTYTVTVTDANGCTVQNQVNISEPTALLVNPTPTAVACNGGSNGTASVNASGGTAPYAYTWNTNPVQNVATATGLTAGNYSVTVTDANGCQVTGQVQVTEPSVLQATASTMDVTCFSGNNGSATVTASGGTVPYTYAWNTIPVQNGNTASGLSAGNYTCTIIDGNGCTMQLQSQINQPPQLQLSATSAAVSCHGGQDGTATVNVSGGTPGYQYSWNTNPVQNTATAGNLASGTYTVTVSDGNGCTANTQISVSEPSLLTASASTNPVSCFGGNNGSVTATAYGGTAPYTYAWNTNPVQTTATASGLVAGSYSVVITDANGCTAQAQVNVTEPSQLIVNPAATSVSCNGGSDGTATANASGGTAPYTYSWNSNPVQTGAVATGLIAGTYTITVTDANGCQTIGQIQVNEPSAIQASASTTDVSCSGGTDGSATVISSGGTPPYTYNWNTNPAQNTSIATGLAAGTYMCTITDANGCNYPIQIQINEPAPLQLSVSATMVSCNGGQDGSAVVSVSGGTPGYQYSWNTNPVQNGQTAVNLSAGNYEVTVTDANGCTAQMQVAVTEPAPLDLNISSTSVSCFGGNDGTASVSISGGTPGYSYSWNTNPPQNGATASGLQAGAFVVTVTDANGCSAQGQVSVTEPAPLQLTMSATDVSCFGGSDGTATAAASGGTQPYSYSWNTNPPQSGATAGGLAAGTWMVTVTDANGCILTSSVTVNQPMQLTAAASGDQTVCYGDAAGFSGSAAGGTPGYSYSWNSNPAGYASGSQNASFNGNQSAVLQLTVTDANGCMATDYTNIIVNPLPAVTFTAGPLQGCDSLDVQFQTPVNAVSYTWNFGDGSGSNLQNPTHQYGNGQYGNGVFNVTLTVTDANGCTNSAIQNGLVEVIPTPVANFTSSPSVSQQILESQPVQFTDLSSNASSWFWDFGDGQVSGDQHPSHQFDPGQYQVTLVAFNKFGCADTATIGPWNVIPDGVIFVPNAFSPNGDGLNDQFILKGEGITGYLLKIYNRWGREVFTTNNPNEHWDGKYQGQDAQEGVYVFVLEASFNNGVTVKKGGDITLIR